MNNKFWFDFWTVVSVVLLIEAALQLAGTIKADWNPTVLVLVAAACFVARDYQW